MQKDKEIRKQLERLGSNKVYLEYLEKEVRMLEQEYGLQGISYDSIGGSGNQTSDSTGDQAMRMHQIKEELLIKKKKKENEINHVEDALKELTELEHDIIIMFYIDRIQLSIIAVRVKYSISQVRRIKEDAMDKLKMSFFGNCE